MIPISRIRSNTDIAIVFVTPMPPMISASSEKIQPASMISRLDVSTLHRLRPARSTATTPGKLLLDALRDVLRAPAELDGDAERRHLAAAAGRAPGRPSAAARRRGRRSGCRSGRCPAIAEARACRRGACRPGRGGATSRPRRRASPRARARAGPSTITSRRVGELAGVVAEDEERVLVLDLADAEEDRARRRRRPGRAATFASSDSGRSDRVRSEAPSWKTPKSAGRRGSGRRPSCARRR